MNEFWLIGLLSACAALTAGSYLGWQRGQARWALGLLMGAAFVLRLAMAGLDPFLHDWDERFHALVARNVMAHPLLPLLRPHAPLPYDYKAWKGNHVWLHKQPLFLWQMALAMKAFGVNVVALRLPSALLGSVLLYPVYRLGRLLYDDFTTGYLAAVLAAFAFFALEQTSGLIGMDHDDVAFTVYVGASIWAYCEYRASARPGRWLVAVGVLAGAAVLCKWLTGLVVYAAWGLDILSDPARRRVWRQYGQAALSAAVALVVWGPWQLFTAYRYPLESAHERAYNARHFSEALEGQVQLWDYHFTLLPVHYGVLAWLLAAGSLWLLVPADRRRPVLPLVTTVVIIYLFFTVAATKMHSYVYVVSPLLFVLMARPLAVAVDSLRARFRGRPWLDFGVLPVLLLALILADARPWGIYAVHFEEGSYALHYSELHRAARSANAKLYAQLDRDMPSDYLIINAFNEDEIQVMFHSGHEVYSWPPSEAQVHALVRQGWRLAAFDSHHTQKMPGYVQATPGFRLIWGVPQ